jgi:CheY-like chemotaxis protein
MPEVNGDQLTDAIKELNPDMPVILLTGFTEASRNEPKQRQADLILAKPFSHASLFNAVEKVMSAA